MFVFLIKQTRKNVKGTLVFQHVQIQENIKHKTLNILHFTFN